jgi:hypothetical protein
MFQYSSIEMITKALDRLFELYDIEDRGSAFVYNQFFEHIDAYRQGNQTHIKMIEAFESKNLEKAISVLSDSKDALKNTYVVQGELMALYAENGQTENALKHAMNLLYRNPKNMMSYVLALVATLQSDEHLLTTQILDVLIGKFDIEITKPWLNLLSNADNFLASSVFADWQVKHQAM